jgi:hypothetical protein
MRSWPSDVSTKFPSGGLQCNIDQNAAFYAQVFPGLTQKVKSGLLRSMWAGETRKIFFALLAQAYTNLRDNHAAVVQLDKFLAAVTGQLPVVPANQYLRKMGWEVVKGADGELSLMRSTSFDAGAVEAEYPSSTNVSAQDLVNTCYDSGLVPRSSRVDPKMRSRTNVMAMPIAPAPTTQAPVQPQVSAFEDFDVSNLP